MALLLVSLILLGSVGQAGPILMELAGVQEGSGDMWRLSSLSLGTSTLSFQTRHHWPKQTTLFGPDSGQGRTVCPE